MRRHGDHWFLLDVTTVVDLILKKRKKRNAIVGVAESMASGVSLLLMVFAT